MSEEKIIVMYTEIHLTEEDAEEAIQSLVENFIKELDEE
jgi:hypothetical protein